MSQSFYAETLFDGDSLLSKQLLTVDNGFINLVQDCEAPPNNAVKLPGLVSPGFIDVQVNGGGGKLFNTEPNLQTLQTMVNAHGQFGTTAMLPTLITDDIGVMSAAADAVAEAIASGSPGILGVHFEGPHLSTPKKGIHPEQHIRPLSSEEMALFCRQDLGKVLVTLAPENVLPEQITALVSAGVHVCLGHTNADAVTTQKALAAGASGFTHLFNAMSAMTSREPGVVGAALADKDSYCGLIVDHYHVHATSCQVAIRCKGYDKIMLVTDAMAHVGSDITSMPYFDTVIERVGDKLTVPDGTLAGSALDMASAVRNCHRDLFIPLTDALNMASLTPASYLQLQQRFGKLQPGYQADLVCLDSELHVSQSWIGGKLCFSNHHA